MNLLKSETGMTKTRGLENVIPIAKLKGELLKTTG